MTAISLLAATPAFAMPVGGQVVGGQASITTSGSQTTITQSTHRGIINWQSFDIGHGEHVLFQQPSASSVTLNRVTGGQGASQILGNLTANGTVMLVNPNGVFFGAGSQVNVGNMVVTSSDIENDRFMAGDYRFDKPGNADAAIVNNGLITAADAGLVSFVAPNVVNNGLIQARLGKVQMASGDTFALDLYGDGLINLEASDALTSQLVSNGGIIAADGGKVLMTAAAAGEVVNSLINMDGIISATSIAERNGEIVIFAEGSNAVAGNDATQKGQKQGSSNVLVSGIVDASGRKAGERGGSITVTGDNVALLDGTLIDASGHTGLAGTTEGKEVSAHREGSAGGDIRIGGDYLGQGDTPTAQNLYVDPGALIVNDALYTGDAGRTIFWSDGTTQFYGNVYARARGGQSVNPLTRNATTGGNTGDGGFVETSGHEHLDAGGYVDLTASSGKRGTYFLDPADITIYGNFDPTFVSTDSSVNLAANLKLWLDASDTSKVTLTYSTDALSSATASGTSGTNTIITSANVSANLAVGARIRLGAAGSITTADTLGADTYTITAISGTTITLSSNLTQNYTTSTLYRGLVSEWADKSGNNASFTQVSATRSPLWNTSSEFGNQHAINFIRTSGSEDFLELLNSNPGYAAFNNAVFQTGDFWIQSVALARSGGQDTTQNNRQSIIHREGHHAGIGFNGHPSTTSASFTGWLGGASTSSANLPVSPNMASIIGGGFSQNGGVYTAVAALNGTTSTGNSGTSLQSSTGHIRIGSARAVGYNYSWFLDGMVPEIVAYNTTLPVNARHLVEQYQSAKWGISLTPPGTGATEMAKATAADGYSAFTTRYIERLSQSADISLQATNSITLDLKGDTLALASDRNLSLTTTSGNISSVSAGTITTTRTGSGGNITLTAGGNGTIDVSNLTLKANNGGNITMNSGGAMALGTMNAGTILARTTGATSDITLNNTITTSASGTAITLASGRNFINNAGSGALSVPSGRWLVYSTNPANDTIGGLTNDFRRFSCMYGGSCPALGSGNGYLYSFTPTLSATPSALAAITTGSPPPNLTGYSYTLSGYLDSDAASDAVTGSLSGSTPYTSASLAGSYALNYQSGSLTSQLGYSFTYDNNSTGVVVSAPAVSIADTSRIILSNMRNGFALTPPSPPQAAIMETPSVPPVESFQDLSPMASGGMNKPSLPGSDLQIEIDPAIQWFFGLPPRL